MSATATAVDIVSALRSVAGDVQSAGPELSIDEIRPDAIVIPRSEDEVAKVLRFSAENGLALIPAGGMTKQGIGGVPDRADLVLSLRHLNKVHHYDPGDLTISVGAGMTLAGLQQVLAEHRLFLPLDPMLPGQATIGGVLAANAGGPLKSGYGGAREFCIGIGFATVDGKRAKGGGRVVKNVAGYDMMKLMIGSLGTLGVITAANFKVYPLPRQTATFQCEFKTAIEAAEFGRKVWASSLGSRLMCLEIISPRAQEYLNDGWDPRDPDHFSPAAPVKHHTAWTVSLRANGSDAVLGRFSKDLGGAISEELSGETEAAWWRWVSDFEVKLAHRHQNAMVIRVSVPQSQVADALSAAEKTAIEDNFVCSAVGRLPAGSLVVGLAPLAVDPPSAMQFANMASALRGRLSRDASAVVLRCPTEAKRHFDVWGTSPTDLGLMRAIRKTMDPGRVLNRGRFIV
ncbi:MAG: FAD-binding oxidoreductase [Acidobacteriales bacterium]|nr:FAD-binding oxidoreductase [Terriglobales bacterium]